MVTPQELADVDVDVIWDMDINAVTITTVAMAVH